MSYHFSASDKESRHIMRLQYAVLVCLVLLPKIDVCKDTKRPLRSTAKRHFALKREVHSINMNFGTSPIVESVAQSYQSSQHRSLHTSQQRRTGETRQETHPHQSDPNTVARVEQSSATHLVRARKDLYRQLSRSMQTLPTNPDTPRPLVMLSLIQTLFRNISLRPKDPCLYQIGAAELEQKPTDLEDWVQTRERYEVLKKFTNPANRTHAFHPGPSFSAYPEHRQALEHFNDLIALKTASRTLSGWNHPPAGLTLQHHLIRLARERDETLRRMRRALQEKMVREEQKRMAKDKARKTREDPEYEGTFNEWIRMPHDDDDGKAQENVSTKPTV